MPYPGVPDAKTKQMERCVADLMADAKMKEKYGDAKERKSHAIAICHSSIMGSKVISSTLEKGGETKMTDEEKKIEEQIKKGDGQPAEPKVEEKKPEAPAPAAPVEAPKVEEKPVEAKPEAPVVEKKEDPKNPKHGEQGHTCDKTCPDFKAEEKKVEKKEEVKAPEITVKVDLTELKDELKKFADGFKEVLEKVAKVEEKISKQAPTEGAAAKGDAPKEVAKVEVAPKEEVKVEKKADTSSEGASEAILKTLGELKKTLEARLEKLEKQPAPSKVVFTKDFGGVKEEGEVTIEKIDKRLNELKKVMTDDPNKYVRENMADEAIALVKQKKALAKK